MQAQYWWWLIAVVLGIAEMFTGTFYLLVLALGALAGGLVALAWPSLAAQALVAALVAVLGWLALKKLVRQRRETAMRPQSNRDVLLDIGERVRVEQWDENGRGHAQYRGARWQVELDRAGQPASLQPGEYQIVRLSGNTLVVGRLP